MQIAMDFFFCRSFLIFAVKNSGKKFYAMGPLTIKGKIQSRFNPILTGGVNWYSPPPPLHEIRDFSWLFAFKSYASFDTKFAKIEPSVARTRDILYLHVGTKFAQNPHFAYMFVYKKKLLIFLKCIKTVFILSLGPFAQFSISWNYSRSNYNNKKKS